MFGLVRAVGGELTDCEKGGFGVFEDPAACDGFAARRVGEDVEKRLPIVGVLLIWVAVVTRALLSRLAGFGFGRGGGRQRGWGVDGRGECEHG